jgi:hypothetical protein
MAGGFSVHIFVPSGNPEGLRVVQKSNWTGQGLVFPRALFAEARLRPEMEGARVYVLWDAANSLEPLPTAYVGQSDGVLTRLSQHLAGKEFWTQAVVFTSKDKGFNKAHAQYVESRLIDLARAAKRCNLENGNAPQPPHLSEADIADSDAFLADILQCLPMVGIGFFEVSRIATDPSDDLLVKSKGIQARWTDRPEGFIVRAASEVVSQEVPSLPSHLRELHASLLKQGVFDDSGLIWRLNQDYTFQSPSMASSVLLGRNSNGRLEWRNLHGQTLKQIQDGESILP